jgi:ubiquinone/menaquinone biosynthesis C-methylase UbiE
MSVDHSFLKRTAEPDPPKARPIDVDIPRYLVERYWWAYLHPAAIAFFDHPWIVNLILWGNFDRLRRAAFDSFGHGPLAGRTLQVACVYGDLTPRLADRLGLDAALDVIDVVPQQLSNLRRKVIHEARVALWLANSTDLGGADGRYDRALIFFLLHEQPEAVRRATLREAVRVVKPGGRVVIIDYHRPDRLNPLRYLMRPLLRWLEPFALDLWQHELDAWLPGNDAVIVQKRLFFGGLYQALVLVVGPANGIRTASQIR